MELRGLEPLTSSMPWWPGEREYGQRALMKCVEVHMLPRPFSPGAPQFAPTPRKRSLVDKMPQLAHGRRYQAPECEHSRHIPVDAGKSPPIELLKHALIADIGSGPPHGVSHECFELAIAGFLSESDEAPDLSGSLDDH